MLSKAALRQAFRANLDRISESPASLEALSHSSHALSKRLADFLKSQSGVWAAFEPFGFEPDIRSAIESAKHILWAFPRVEHANTLSFYRVSSRNDLLKNSLGIWEPDPKRAVRVHLDEFHGLLIPGLAFDHFGNRLGRGRGYYDRALSEILHINQPLKIGIALERQIAEQELPHEPHDIAMDLVITESRSLTRPLAGALSQVSIGSSKGSLS
jgi:5-formyltetrahydrofolate cyclo-ligase